MRKKWPKPPSLSCLLRRTPCWATLGKEEELSLLPEDKMGNKRVISPHLWKAESCSVITCTQEERVCVKILDNSTVPIKGHSSVQLPLVIRFMI